MADEDHASQSEDEYPFEHTTDPTGPDGPDQDESDDEGSFNDDDDLGIDYTDFEGSGSGTLTERADDPCDYEVIEELEALDDRSTDESNEHVIVGKTTIPTSQYISKLEKTHVLGLRSQQIKSGAPPMIRPDETFPYERVHEDGTVEIVEIFAFEGGQYPLDTYKIAEKELEFGRCPIIIGRPLPNGEKILIPVSKLKLI